jgi:hypothetical protein
MWDFFSDGVGSGAELLSDFWIAAERAGTGMRCFSTISGLRSGTSSWMTGRLGRHDSAGARAMGFNAGD